MASRVLACTVHHGTTGPRDHGATGHGAASAPNLRTRYTLHVTLGSSGPRGLEVFSVSLLMPDSQLPRRLTAACSCVPWRGVAWRAVAWRGETGAALSTSQDRHSLANVKLRISRGANFKVLKDVLLLRTDRTQCPSERNKRWKSSKLLNVFYFCRGRASQCSLGASRSQPLPCACEGDANAALLAAR